MNKLNTEQENPFEKEDFTHEIDFSSLETTLTKEEKNKCFEVVQEVRKYLKTDREKLYMIERLILELDDIHTSEIFMSAIKSSRKKINKKEGESFTSISKKGLIL
jgi:hypothetical protein